MAIPQIVAGAYSSTYNAKACGMTRDGYRLSHEFFKRLITADEGGDTPLNAVYRGRAQFCEFELIEALKAAVVDLIEPYSDPYTLGEVGATDLTVGLCTGAAKALILTSLGACTASPAAITLPLCILAEGYPINLLHSSDPRNIPIRLRVYPGTDGVFATVS
jgi:hypothetical protein